MLLWEMHKCYSEMRSPSLGYVQVLLDNRALFIFSLQRLIWKIITFFWKGKYFMKCFCEKHTCVTLKWEVVIRDMLHLLLEVSAVFIFCVDAWHWKIITFFWKGKNFMKSFFEKPTCVTLKWVALFRNMSKFLSKLEQCSLSLWKFNCIRYSRSFERVRNSCNAFVRNAHVLISNEKP